MLATMRPYKSDGYFWIKKDKFGDKRYEQALRKNSYFPGPGISQKAQKDHTNIIFPSTFWLKKRPYFPSPKSSKQELFSNQ